MDWLDAWLAQRVVGVVLVVSLRRWRNICTIVQLQPIGSKNRYLKKCTKPCWPIRSKETWTKYTPTTSLGQAKLTLPGEKHFLHYKIIGAPKKFKNWPRPLLRPRTDHACPQKPNPSRETVPLNLIFNPLVRLSRYVRPSSLRKVPSLSVFASKEVPEDEENLLRDQDYLYAHTKVRTTLLHLPPLRFHCADRCWERTQDRCNQCCGSMTFWCGSGSGSGSADPCRCCNWCIGIQMP